MKRLTVYEPHKPDRNASWGRIEVHPRSEMHSERIRDAYNEFILWLHLETIFQIKNKHDETFHIT